MGKNLKRIALLSIVGIGVLGVAKIGVDRAKKDHAAAVATYEMSLPPMEAEWIKRPHGPFLKDKYISKKTGSMITLGESHGDADYLVTPDEDETALAQIVVQAGEYNGWKTLSVGKPEKIGGARFVFVERTAGNHTYWTAVGVQGNSSYILALTETGSDKERESNLRDEFPYFRNLVANSTFRRDPPSSLVALR